MVDEYGALGIYGDRPVSLAGAGAPGRSEFAAAELAAAEFAVAVAVGVSPFQGRAFLGAALECRHRLPRIWARVVAGEVPVWQILCRDSGAVTPTASPWWARPMWTPSSRRSSTCSTPPASASSPPGLPV